MSWKKWILTIAVSLVIVYGVFPSYAAEYERQTIRVGYPIQKGLTEIDEQGAYFGYTYEYLMEIAQYTGWNYEFIQVPGEIDASLTALFDMLEAGEIDLMGGILYSDQMEERYDFAGYNYGTVYTVLNVLQEDVTRYMSNSMNKKTLRVAALETSVLRIRELEVYCKMNQITLKIVNCKDQEEQIALLQEGRADALLDVSVNYMEGMRSIARFSPRPFYFVTTKGRLDLVKEINAAIMNIEYSEPYFTTSLFEKYFAYNLKDFWLAEEEKFYINQTRTLRAGILMNMPPFLFSDKSGGLRGINIEYLQYITEKTGLQFELVPAFTEREMDNLINEHKIDIVVGMTYNYKLSEKRYLAMSRPFMSGQYAMFLNDKCTEGELAGKRLALSENMAYDGEFFGEITEYETIEECLKAVQEGKADYTYLDSYSALFYKNLPQYGNIQLIPQTYKHQLCFGIVSPVRNELLNILNKIIATMDAEHLQTIINQNTAYYQDLSLVDFIAAHPLPVIMFISGVLLIIIGILTWGIRTRNHMNKKISLDLKKYLLIYELASEYFFEYDYKSGTIMVSFHDDHTYGSGNRLFTYDFNKMDEHMGEAEREQVQKFLELITSKEDGTVERQFICQGGTYHWFRLVMKTMYDEESHPVYVVGKITDIESEKAERDTLLEQAQRDSLTRLYNLETSRNLITEELNALKNGMHGAFILLDIDHFKSVNDTFGHMRGDQTICQVAKTLSDCFSSQDIVGRPGGDEFIVYIRELKDETLLREKCALLCERMRSILIEEDRYVTVSVGAEVSCAGQKYNNLYLSVDQALYRAKANGRNGFVIQEKQSYG